MTEITKRIALTLSEDVVELLYNLAEKQNLTPSQVVEREILRIAGFERKLVPLK